MSSFPCSSKRACAAGKTCVASTKMARTPISSLRTAFVKMSAKHTDSVMNLITQMRTALNTPVKDAKTHQKLYPSCVMLVASGEINKHAQEHIVDEVNDHRLAFQDSDDLIPVIDKKMPELWLGIDTKRLPYLKALRDHLVNQSDTIDMTQIGVSSTVASPITDDTFVQLSLHKYTKKSTKSHGQVETTIDVEEFSVQDLLKKPYPFVLVSGDAGAGKTTSLRRLAMLLTMQALQSSEDRNIPIFLRTIDIARTSGRLTELAADTTTKIAGESSAAFERSDLIAGNVTLLLDGYDELGTSELRTAFSQKMSEFNKEFPRCRIFLTSRESPYLKDIEAVIDFTRLRVSPINLKQAGKIIERISKGKDLPTHATEDILRQLDTVHGIDLSPLLVTVFVATTDYARTDIPANITELFAKFAEMMLGRWDQSKGLAQQYQANVKDFLLCRIAFEMHKESKTIISIADFKSSIAQILTERTLSGDTEILYDEIVNRSGLVRVVDDELSFRHLLLQEFFAGKGIPSAEFMRSVLGKNWWMRAIIFYFGSKPSDEAALSTLPTQLDEMDGSDLYQAAITVGLSIQACYLTRTEAKVEVMEWVVHSMAHTFDDVLAWFGEQNPAVDILRTVFYFIYGRDGVSAKVIADLSEKMFAECANIEPEKLTEYQERSLFWCIIGLIGLGEADEAETRLKDFHPKDLRLLVCIVIAAVYLEKVKVSSSAQKKAAHRIADKLRPLTAHLVKNVIKEMKGVLLEVRSDGVKAIDGPRSHEEMESEYCDGVVPVAKEKLSPDG